MDMRTPTTLDSVLTRQLTRAHFPGTTRKQVLREAARLIAEHCEGVIEHRLFSRLMEREHLGSTGLGFGTAIPHCRLSALESPLCAFLKLEQPIDFDASDGQLVDLMMVMVASEQDHQDHLAMLAASARVLGEAENRAAIRACDSDEALYSLLLKLEYA